ncbi:MAG: DUF1549 domain-containing protein [Planctomycetes bacterium]|nr:DUF1549 domain-containing protein [Planctomycetota bacterium]
MLIKLRLVVLGLGCWLAWSIAGTPDLEAQPKFDRDAAFKRADADGDGKISKEEWRKFQDNAPKFKGKSADGIFNFLDSNKDGSITLEEFKRPAPFGPKKDSEPKVEKPIEKPATAEQIAFFEKSIRPVLLKECYSCHSANAEKLKGGLRVDTSAGLRQGGDTGPALVPGNASRSLIMKALKHHDENLKMPPKMKLADDVVADFEKWIAMGAADPREGSAKVAKNEIDIEKGRQFWAFQPVKKPAAPTVKNATWAKTDIDRHLLAGLEAKNLKPVADADPYTLIRRLYIDLIGLPPTPEDVLNFVSAYQGEPAQKQAALEKVVDQLLASPRFGERWGRHWLDVARYAESSGKQSNIAYPHAWRYRDYVIAAFNADKPFDQFVREQIAGDLLSAKDDKQKADFVTATGFLAIGAKAHNERNPRQFQLDLADEQIDVTFTAFQGLTVACARCHDHKFDPIPTKDYYSLVGIFQSTETCYGTVRVIQSNHPSPLITLPKGAEAPTGLEPLSATRRESLEKQVKDLKEQMAKLSMADQFGSFNGIRLRIQITNTESQLALYEADGTPRTLAMGVREKSFPTDSRVYVRGELDQPGETVKRGLPQVLVAKQPAIGRTSGRLDLAKWIASAENPLTARVMANRVWLHLFGRGLVATPDNFGASGQTPSSPALLDHLATTFVAEGWSVKKLIRSIVLSRVYQLSSNFDERNYEVDPDNVLAWRMSKRRLEAESMRDAMLSVSGLLDVNPRKGSPITRNGEGSVNMSFRFRPIDTYTSDPHRSVYIPIIRDLLPEVLTLFDFPDPSMIAGERSVTTIPAQSLYLMNNAFVIKQAETVADKLLASTDSDEEMLKRAYVAFFSRPPSAKEIASAQQFLKSYAENKTRRASWSALCQALFASAEFSQR